MKFADFLKGYPQVIHREKEEHGNQLLQGFEGIVKSEKKIKKCRKNIEKNIPI